MSKVSFRLSKALAGGRIAHGPPGTREDVLVTLLRKRAAAHNAGLMDLERQLREQIRWALPVRRLEDESADPSLAGSIAAAPAAPDQPPFIVPAVAAKPARPPRQAVAWPGELYWDESVVPVRLRNISPEGAMLAGHARLSPGKEVVLALKSAGTIFATVRWSRSGLVGLKFDKSFDIGKLLRLAGGREHGGNGRSRPGVVRPLYLESETDPDSPWAARWEKLRPEDL